MIKIVLDPKGVSRINKRLDKTRVNDRLAKGVFLVASTLEGNVKRKLQQVIYSRRVPWKRTGGLQQSVSVNKLSPLTSQVTVGKKYGKFVEQGRRGFSVNPNTAIPIKFKDGGVRFFRSVKAAKKRPFWRPALAETKKQMPSILQRFNILGD